MQYLYKKQHYIDRYDLSTIRQCLDTLDLMRDVYKKSAEVDKQFSKADRAKTTNWMANQYIYSIRGERYQHKEETIKQWMLEDENKQNRYDNAKPPAVLNCKKCDIPMAISGTKHIDYTADELRDMFIFECPECKKRKWIYEDGAERKSKPYLCPKCKSEAKMSIVRETKEKVVWKTACSTCGFEKKTVDDLKKDREKWKKEEDEDKRLLTVYREEFCSDKNGKESFEYIESLKVANVVYEEELRKYDSQAYQQIDKLKKLTIHELEKLINNTINKKKFVKLSFDKPEINQHVIVPFTIQDINSKRTKNESTFELRSLIKKCLEDTNWRLMTDTLSYRLGYISGRLKGYENEEDFFKLAGKKQVKQKSEIDDELRKKYAHNNVVQLARISGEYKGILNTRMRRLKNEPDGFLIDSSDDHYSCEICDEKIYGKNAWWNPDGISCHDCHRNILEGVIPSELLKNTDIQIQNFEFKSDFNIHPSTVRKLKREGVLIGRDLLRKDGKVYFTVYLIEDNKEFLKKYPRNPRKSPMTITDLLGEKVAL